jgi:uncharacterized membrane protein
MSAETMTNTQVEGSAELPSGTQGAGRTNILSLLAVAGAGAAAMFFLDPARGRRRRHLARDKVVHQLHDAGAAIATTGRDLSNRTRGLVAAARHRFDGPEIDDVVLVERIRSALGRATSHPRALEVAAREGRVTVRGPVLSDEAAEVIACISKVRGVRSVDDQLERHEIAGNVAALQGDAEPASPTFELLQENWTPAARLVAGVTGGLLAVRALREDERTDPLSAAMGIAGAALLVRSATNMSFDRLLGVAAGRRAIGVQKSINIAAPIDDVFNWLIAWEHWPRWMSHVREVSATTSRSPEGERTHWIVDGPAGTTVEWDAITTRFVPPSLIAWKTVEGSPVAHAGTIRLVPTDEGETRVDVQMTYNPVAGAAGHLVAALFRRDPKRQLNDDLARLKTTIESGIPPHDAAARSAPPELTAPRR